VADENEAVEDLTGNAGGHRPRVVVVTGATSGIGLAAAEERARAGDEVALVGRDPARLDAALSRVRRGARVAPRGFLADYAVLDQVRRLAGELSAAYPRIDVLANNAGALVPRQVTTVDGYELTMQANHLAPFLLTYLLRERLSRVVTTASRAHQQGRLSAELVRRQPFDGFRRYVPLLAYGSSKQANILFAVEAARRWPDVLSTSYHPGVVRSRYGHDTPLIAAYYRWAPGLRTPQKGADTLVWLATAPAADLVNGGYYVDRRLRRPAARSADPQLARLLWEASLAAVGLS
jgi:NAD(P)-dependent dehydrogenase (short-subunit alcohol dehydrogenase family)